MGLPVHTVAMIKGCTPYPDSFKFNFGMLVGAAMPQPAAVPASGSITFSTVTNPSNNSTISIAGTTVTFVNSGASGLQVNIGANAAATLTALLAFLQASADTNLVKCTYAANTGTGVLTITAVTPGTGGNALVLAASSSPNSQGTVSNNAVGTFTFSANPVALSTITIAGTTVTFETSGAAGNQVNLGASLTATLIALLAFLQGSADANLSACTYAVNLPAGTLTVTAVSAATALNLATAGTSHATISAIALTGGLAAGAAGQPSVLAVTGFSLPANYAAVGNPSDGQDAVVSISNKTNGGFTVTTRPRVPSGVLVAGTVDILISH